MYNTSSSYLIHAFHVMMPFPKCFGGWDCQNRKTSLHQKFASRLNFALHSRNALSFAPSQESLTVDGRCLSFPWSHCLEQSVPTVVGMTAEN